MEEHSLVEWKALVVGRENPQIFNERIHSFGANGWTSQINSEYPLDIVIGLEYEAVLSKVELTVLTSESPNFVEVRLGRTPHFTVNYQNAKHAKYKTSGRVEFNRRADTDHKYQTQILYFNESKKFRYMWLIFHEATRRKHKASRQITIVRIDIFGRSEELGCPNKPLAFQNKHSASGKQLSTIQLLKGILKQKKLNAMQEGKEFEMNLCITAIHKIREYEWEALQFRGKMALAFSQGNNRSVEHFRAILEHTRDMLYRNIHLDLLLNGEELRALKLKNEDDYSHK